MLFADLERPEVSYCSAAVLLCSGLYTIGGETATKQRSVFPPSKRVLGLIGEASTTAVERDRKIDVRPENAKL